MGDKDYPCFMDFLILSQLLRHVHARLFFQKNSFCIAENMEQKLHPVISDSYENFCTKNSLSAFTPHPCGAFFSEKTICIAENILFFEMNMCKEKEIVGSRPAMTWEKDVRVTPDNDTLSLSCPAMTWHCHLRT